LLRASEFYVTVETVTHKAKSLQDAGATRETGCPSFLRTSRRYRGKGDFKLKISNLKLIHERSLHCAARPPLRGGNQKRARLRSGWHEEGDALSDAFGENRPSKLGL